MMIYEMLKIEIHDEQTVFTTLYTKDVTTKSRQTKKWMFSDN